jgi:hypothetical protein
VATEIRPAKFVIINVAFKASVVVFAGNTPSEASSGLFQTDGNPTMDLIDEIFQKTIQAIHSASPSINLNIRDGRFIERDDSFNPHVAALDTLRSAVASLSTKPAVKRSAAPKVKPAAKRKGAKKKAGPK